MRQHPIAWGLVALTGAMMAVDFVPSWLNSGPIVPCWDCVVLYGTVRFFSFPLPLDRVLYRLLDWAQLSSWQIQIGELLLLMPLSYWVGLQLERFSDRYGYRKVIPAYLVLSILVAIVRL